jgi:hypothetical protein
MSQGLWKDDAPLREGGPRADRGPALDLHGYVSGSLQGRVTAGDTPRLSSSRPPAEMRVKGTS